jgi:hypothetical protein
MTSKEAMPIIREIFVQELAKANGSGTSSTTGKAPPVKRTTPAAPAKPRNPASLN